MKSFILQPLFNGVKASFLVAAYIVLSAYKVFGGNTEPKKFKPIKL